jgi:bifunctional DNase/RNase
MEYPWVAILKSKSSSVYLPVHVSEKQAELIQNLLLGRTVPLESLLKDLSLPVEQVNKAAIESIIIESTEENRYQAKIILRCDGRPIEADQAVIPVGSAITLSLATKTPLYADEAVLIYVDEASLY